MKKFFLVGCVFFMILMLFSCAVFAGSSSFVEKLDPLDGVRHLIDARLIQSFAAMKCPDFENISPEIIKLRFNEVVDGNGNVDPKWFDNIAAKVNKISKNKVVVLLDNSEFGQSNARILLLNSEKSMQIQISNAGKIK